MQISNTLREREKTVPREGQREKRREQERETERESARERGRERKKNTKRGHVCVWEGDRGF